MADFIHTSSGTVSKEDRRAARENAFRLLFEELFHSDEDRNEFFRAESDNLDLIGNTDFVKAVYDGVLNHVSEIDALISSSSNGWTLNRLSRVTLTVLRIGVYEMKYYASEHHEELNFAVSINEAIELARKYDDDKSPAFVNGVLNGVAVSLGLKNNG